MKSSSSRLLVARFLTRSGDQAWDFTVPIAVLQMFPGELRVAALYYLVIKVAQTLFLPKFAKVIDRVNRRPAIRIGIGLQLLGVVGGAFALNALWGIGHEARIGALDTLGVLVFSGFVSSLGSSFTDISVANDLVPAAIPSDGLATFNSRLRQIDLFTEVASPIVAGLLLASNSYAGFLWVALWNIVSFLPEYGILSSVLSSRSDLNLKEIVVPNPVKVSLSEKLLGGWRAFFRESIWPSMACYALLWLSVLSPHGVLLTGFLKDGWHLPEWEIGLFRGAGALFGLLATLIFPVFEKKFGYVQSSRKFVLFQAMCVLGSLMFFFADGRGAQIGFLVLILFSRIGLYGFSLGEVQIRQVNIAPYKRGEINGFAGALTSLATIGLFAAGALLSHTEEFKWLVVGSTTFVVISSLWFSFWASSWLKREDTEEIFQVSTK